VLIVINLFVTSFDFFSRFFIFKLEPYPEDLFKFSIVLCGDCKRANKHISSLQRNAHNITRKRQYNNDVADEGSSGVEVQNEPQQTKKIKEEVDSFSLNSVICKLLF